jgi:hypothetical protein
VILLVEANKTVLVGSLRLVDLVDMAVLAPFYLAVLLGLHAAIFAGRLETRPAWLSLGLVSACLYGHAMHLTANAIDTYSFEVRAYRAVIPPDVAGLVHFLDEDLGHWLFYGGLFLLFGLWTWSPGSTGASLAEASVSWARLSAWAAGVLFGLTLAVALVESSHPWIAWLAAPWLAASTLAGGRAAGRGLTHFLDRQPVARFTLAAALALLAGQLAYFLITGGLIQPSQL